MYQFATLILAIDTRLFLSGKKKPALHGFFW